MMVSADQLRELVSEYLRGVVELESFSNRFALLFDDVEESNDVVAIQLAYQIESLLADVSAGFASETELRENLIPCLIHVAVMPEYQNKETTVKKQMQAESSPLPEAVFA